MAQVTWKGEDELHVRLNEDGHEVGGAGPSFTTWNGVKFPKGEPVEIRSYFAVQKAVNNPFFDVTDPDDVDDAPKKKPGRPRKDADAEDAN